MYGVAAHGKDWFGGRYFEIHTCMSFTDINLFLLICHHLFHEVDGACATGYKSVLLDPVRFGNLQMDDPEKLAKYVLSLESTILKKVFIMPSDYYKSLLELNTVSDCPGIKDMQILYIDYINIK